MPKDPNAAILKTLNLPNDFCTKDPKEQMDLMTPLETKDRLDLFMAVFNEDQRIAMLGRFGAKIVYEFLLDAFIKQQIDVGIAGKTIDVEREANDKNKALVKTLMDLGDTAKLLQDTVETLVSPPFSYVEIVGFTTLTVPAAIASTFADYGLEPWKAFKVGTLVRLNTLAASKSKAFGACTGTITELNTRDKGFVRVSFTKADGATEQPDYWYGTGMPESDGDPGQLDLELVDVAATLTPDAPVVSKQMVVILHNGNMVEVFYPPFLAADALQIGQTVKIRAMQDAPPQIIEIVKDVKEFGEVKVIDQVLSPTEIQIVHADQKKVVLSGLFSGLLQEGDRVLTDKSQSIVLKNLGKEPTRKRKVTATKTPWDAIGGLEDAKRMLREAVELPEQQAELFAKYGKQPSKGVLLYGAPGCGKTLLAKAVATSMAALHENRGIESNFISVKGPEILDQFVGESERKVRDLFNQARAHYDAHGYRAVIFIDEADAIMSKRGNHHGALSHTIVPQFLTEMDGMEDSCAIVILATNRPDMLDPAIIRDGRISRKIRITRPTRQDAESILAIYLAKTPLHHIEAASILAPVLDAFYSDASALYHVDTTEGTRCFHLGHLASGAMFTGLVDLATSRAMQRELQTSEASGVTLDDLMGAVQDLRVQNADMNMEDDMETFMESLNGTVIDGTLRKAVILPSNT